jgi:hypothetical protein
VGEILAELRRRSRRWLDGRDAELAAARELINRRDRARLDPARAYE